MAGIRAHQDGRAPSRLLAGLSIVACSLTAGSIYCFPLFGPSLTRDLGLSLLQTNSIWGGAVFGQYFSASLMGHLGDTYGPRPLALIASVLFGTGYLLMAHTEWAALDSQRRLSPQANDQRAASTAVVALTAYFVLVGAGVAASVFGALRSSTTHFGGKHPGLALSVPLTLFSLSSLFLSSLASLSTFTDSKTGDLNGPKWLAFLGAGLMLINALAAFGLTAPPPPLPTTPARPDGPAESQASEASPLLPPVSHSLDADSSRLAYTTPFATTGVLPQSASTGKLSIGKFAQVPAVWALALILFASVGGAEMVMSSVGSIVVSLRYGHLDALAKAGGDDEHLGKETLALRASQVQLIAIANTVARLFAGLASDVCSPTRPRPSRGDAPWLSRVRVSRMTMLLGGLILLLGGFLYAAFLLDSVESLWIVSLATGLGYGLTFTLVPSTVLVLWPAQFGRNYGLLTYAAATGSLAFSMLFAAVNDAASRPSSFSPALFATSSSSIRTTPSEAASGAICKYGRDCFESSFLAASVALVAALAVTVPLWRAWRHSL